MNKEQRLEKVITSIISSLISHLPFTYKKTTEGKAFHKKCIKDYATDIKNLSDLF